MVIVILGIMAAIAVPKFVDLQTDARASVIRGVEGSIRSAATLVYSKSLINGTESQATDSVSIPTGTVDTVFGYPAATATGINAIVDITGAPSINFAVSAGNATYTYDTRATCIITYEPATATTAPVITVDDGGC
ncbi:type II secretion system protein [Aliikangiella sp. IMCC44359]|uniref:type II secretion system protein n=1 Tax=Aliikangiella sp. IMCC44359 TaxID=3459125 RepID=UPI00403A9A17